MRFAANNKCGIFSQTLIPLFPLQKRTELPDDGIVEDRTWFELSKIAH
jgi:hypothetical protein